MAWGGFANGAIPVWALVEFEGTGKLLQADACSSLTRLFDATEQATGARPFIAAGQDLNRPLAEQITLLGENYTAVTSAPYAFEWDGKLWRKTGPITCAEPGFSNHGWATAADISFPTAECRTWFRAHCTEYDWTNAGDAFSEDWHKEYHGPVTTLASVSATPIINATPVRESGNEMIRFIFAINGGNQWTAVNMSTGRAFRAFNQADADSLSADLGFAAETVTAQVLANTIALAEALSGHPIIYIN